MLLADQPILILVKEYPAVIKQASRAEPASVGGPMNAVERVKAIRSQSHQSWSNIRKAARALQGLRHTAFGTSNVERNAKSCVRKIQAETGLSFAEIETIADAQSR